MNQAFLKVIVHCFRPVNNANPRFLKLFYFRDNVIDEEFGLVDMNESFFSKESASVFLPNGQDQGTDCRVSTKNKVTSLVENCSCKGYYSIRSKERPTILLVISKAS